MRSDDCLFTSRRSSPCCGCRQVTCCEFVALRLPISAVPRERYCTGVAVDHPQMISPQENKHASVSPRTIAVNSRTTIVIKSTTAHNDGYENPLTEQEVAQGIAEQQQVSSRKASAPEVENFGSSLKDERPSLKAAQQARGQAATSWLATPCPGAGSPVRESVEPRTNAEGAGRARRKRTHVEYSEDAQEAQAVRRAAAEEARRRRTQGQTGVRVGHKFQAVVPDWEGGEAPDRNDELLSKAQVSCGEELSA